MSSIPDVELHTQFLSIEAEVWEALRGVFERSVFITGPELTQFEGEFAAFNGRAHGVGVGSGTDALAIALQAAGIGEGDDVVTAPNSVYPTARAITLTGARPVFADIDPVTNNIDPRGLEMAWTDRTKAVLPVHLYGYPADMDVIMDISRSRGAIVIEDACQAAGSRLHGRRTGSFGQASCFSFYPSKNLGSYGDGGMILTDDPIFAERARKIRWFGQTERDHFQGEGRNSRLDEIQAAMLRVKLKRLDEWNDSRRSIAAVYDDALTGVVSTPARRPGFEGNFHLYVIRTERRDALRAFLAGQGITTQIHYRVPLHLVQPLRWLAYKEGDFPHAEANAARILSLPMYPELPHSDARCVAAAIRSFMREGVRDD